MFLLLLISNYYNTTFRVPTVGVVVQSRGTRLQDSTETPNKLLYFFRRKESCLCLIIISNNQLDGTDRDRSFRENQTKCTTSMHPNCMCY